MLLWTLLQASAAEPVDERRLLAALRALAYDRKLSERAGPRVDLAIVHAGDVAAANHLAEILTGLGSITLQDRGVDFRSIEAARFLSESLPVDVVLLMPDCSSRAQEISSNATKRGALTAGFSLEDVEHGAALVVINGPDRLRLIVDQSAARDAGASFSSQLLQLAEVRP